MPRRLRPLGPSSSTRSPRLRPAAFALAVVLALLPLLADGALAATRLDWGSRAPMPTARAGIGLAAAPNGKLYAIGGREETNGPTCAGSDTCPTVEEYDPSTNTWTTKREMGTARGGLGVAVATNGKLYAVGGRIAGTDLNVVEEYDPAADTWTTKDSMPTPRSGFGLAASSNGKLYAVGGSVGGTSLRTVEEYDPATDTWTTKAQLLGARANVAVVAAPNGRIYAVGGTASAGGDYLATAEAYDPATDSWMARSSMLGPRGFHAAAMAPNGKLYAVGGYGGGPLETVEEYDPVADMWSARAPMAVPRQGLGLATAPNGKLYAVGGLFAIHGLVFDTVEEYDPATDTWSRVPPRAPMTTARFALGVATGTNGKLYAIGGRSSGTHLSTVQEYTPSVDNWQTRQPMPGGGRSALGVAAHPNGLIYAVGGGDVVTYLGRTEAYNPATDSWQGGLDELDIPRQSLGVVVGSDGLVYAAGGFNGAGDRAEVDAYNPSTNTWTSRAALSIARQAPALVALPNGTLYAIGGYNGAAGGALATVERYTIATNTWSPVTAMATKRYGLQAFLGPNGHIYAVGGQTDGTTFTGVVEAYDPATNLWRTVASMPTARTGHGVALAPNGRGFAIGGFNGDPAGLQLVEELLFTETPTASAGGPYNVPAGAPVTLSGFGTDPEGSPLAFAWDIDGDLLYDATGQSPTVSTAGITPGVRAARIRALDDRGAYGLASATLTIAPAVQLVFSTQPVGAQAGQPLARQPVVQALDDQGRVVPAFNGPVTLSFGANPGGGTLGGTPTVNAATGVATFTDLLASAAGAGYTLVASAPGLTPATSAPFTITAPPSVCNPRPNVGVTSAPAGPGLLQTTVSANTSAATPVNALVGIRVTQAQNAVVTVNGSPATIGNQQPVPGGTTQVVVLVQRQAPGQATTVSFVVTDSCGEWPTLVGGGPAAF